MSSNFGPSLYLGVSTLKAQWKFVPAKPFKLNLIFVGTARAYPSGPLWGVTKKKEVLWHCHLVKPVDDSNGGKPVTREVEVRESDPAAGDRRQGPRVDQDELDCPEHRLWIRESSGDQNSCSKFRQGDKGAAVVSPIAKHGRESNPGQFVLVSMSMSRNLSSVPDVPA